MDGGGGGRGRGGEVQLAGHGSGLFKALLAPLVAPPPPPLLPPPTTTTAAASEAPSYSPVHPVSLVSSGSSSASLEGRGGGYSVWKRVLTACHPRI